MSTLSERIEDLQNALHVAPEALAGFYLRRAGGVACMAVYGLACDLTVSDPVSCTAGYSDHAAAFAAAQLFPGTQSAEELVSMLASPELREAFTKIA